MKDITLTSAVDDFRAEVPGPDDAHIAAARARILAGADVPRGGRGPSRVRRTGRVRPWPVLAAAATVAIALAAGSVATGGTAPEDAGPGRPPEALVLTMQRAAAAVELDSGPHALAPGQFWYTRERTVDNSAERDDESWEPACTVSERWLDADGLRRDVVRECADAGEGPIVSQDSYPPLVEEPGPRPVESEPDPGAPGNWFMELRSLPTDPDAVFDHITRQADTVTDEGSTQAEKQFFQASILLSDLDAPPALRKALFEIVPRIDGVRLLGPTADGLDRPGVAIAGSTGSGGHLEIIIDPDRGELLGERRVSTYDDGSVRREVSFTSTLVVSGVVASVDQRL